MALPKKQLDMFAGAVLPAKRKPRIVKLKGKRRSKHTVPAPTLGSSWQIIEVVDAAGHRHQIPF